MRPDDKSSPATKPKAADADLLGEAASLEPPHVEKADDAGKGAQSPVAPSAPAAAPLPDPPPAEDENQPGFIGKRNRPTS